MADVDDEILALVGGDDESDNEGSGSEQDMNESRSGSVSPEPESPEAKKAAPPKKTEKRQHDSGEEEGEASSAASSPASQQSAPMDESDSDAGSPVTNNANGAIFDDDNKYPFEGMYTSEKEKEEIESMREVERETLLAERMQEIERQRQNRLLRQLVSQGEHDKKQPKKRKANDADLEETQRKTSRQRTKLGGSKVGERSEGIETLRRARAEKSDRQRRLAEDRERNKDKSISISRASPDGDASANDDGWLDDKRHSRSRTPEIREVPLADLRDFERVRLGRSRFASICFFPGLDEAMTGCYVRIAIGPDQSGNNVYRMAVIKRFTTGKPYAMEKSNGHSFVTDQYLVAAHGKSEREWPFISCSDGEFTESEFNRLKSTIQSEGGIFPKKPTLVAKIDDINKLRGRQWTEAELDEKLQRERTLLKKFAPTERNRIANLVEEAKQRGDDAKATELQDQLDAMETSRLAFRTSLTPAKKAAPTGPSQQDRLYQLNIENRRRNAESVRKAQMREKMKLREETLGTKKKRSLTPGSGTSTPANGNGTPNLGASKAPVLPNIAKLQQQTGNGTDNKGVPQIHRPLQEDDVIGSIDLGLDIDFDDL